MEDPVIYYHYAFLICCRGRLTFRDDISFPAVRCAKIMWHMQSVMYNAHNKLTYVQYLANIITRHEMIFPHDVFLPGVE